MKKTYCWQNLDDIKGYDANVALIMFLGKLKILGTVGHGFHRHRGVLVKLWIMFGK